MIQYLLPLHVICIAISLLLFVWRGLRMWTGKPLATQLWRRTVPDKVDTLLLASGIGMAFLLGISPLDSGWLAAKIGGLLAYISLGVVALKANLNPRLKRCCFIAALGMFAYIIAVARSMNPMPWT
jgi:uncharacterized membrane protein SirB2